METKTFGAKEMIDITRMRTLYNYRDGDSEIEQIFQVSDNNEPLLAEIGQTMIDGNLDKFKQFLDEGEIKMIFGRPIPETNAVYCLYIPPYYVFTDLKRLFC